MRLRSLVFWLVAVVLVAAIAAAILVVFLMVRRGFSARDEPSWAERFVARRVRGQKILSAAFFGWAPKTIDLDLSLSKIHAAVNRGDLVSESHSLEPAA